MRMRFLSFMILASAAQAADYPAPVQALVHQGLEIQAQFDTPAGLKGYAGRVQGQTVALYLAPDGKHVVVGTMLDAKGTDLTEGQLKQHLPEPDYSQAWSALEKAAWVQEGAPTAKRVVYVFTDPNCPFCNRLWSAMNPYAGKDIQIRHIMVGILTPTSLPKAATILADPSPAKALEKHERSYAQGGIAALKAVPGKAKGEVEANNRLMASLGVAATPAVFFKDAQGKVRRVVGLPKQDLLHTEILQLPPI